MNLPTLPHRVALLFVLLCSTVLIRAGESGEIAALRAADDERVAAILAADSARLDAIFSDDLSYTHSNGKHDTKKSYIDSLVTHSTVYRVYDYQERTFRLVSPEIALENARVLVTSANGAAVNNLDLSILAVWRKESGKWRFLAWQSARLPTAPAAK
jgi:ketosteroid isomerase-like protein